ncbi:receptor-like protein EIX1 [Humulus lupulus]|uniref:receptor-like protein EIX1 n=1 Tax=Humulus lupulus TaxID=3486 RepID=UPI002B410423|nr:receptor-like protein EIX1 [Humulus lupulus]
MAAISITMNHVTLIILLVFLAEVTMLINVCFAKEDSNILCIDTEKQALLRFKQDLVDHSSKLGSWDVSKEEDCCKWAGIVCNTLTGHVSELSLKGGSFTGKINSSLLNLTHLISLDLSLNNFGGIIPSFMGSLVSLRYLNFTRGGFEGKIPHQLGNLSNLCYLGLGDLYYSPDQPGWYNSLYVENLHWISTLSSLESLVMNEVNLSKAYDHWLLAINRIPSLLELRLQSCGLSHTHFPSHINLTSLETLDLSYNSLELRGSIPCSFRNNMSLLKYLDFSNNDVDSIIPSCIYGFPNLEYLHLSNNKLQGAISSTIANLTFLVSLDLSHNALVGKIPKSMGNLCNLEAIDLSSNRFKVKVSEVFESLSGCLSRKLKLLYLNWKIMEEGSEIGNCITGQIPNEIGDFFNLGHLTVSNTEISGPIPMSLFGKLLSLKWLDLSFNNLNGFLPETLASLSHLEHLDISKNQLSGTLPHSLGSLSNLEFLECSNNHLSGPLPQSLGSLSKLRFLGIYNNKLSGSLPKSVGSSLEILDISNNQLSGPLPTNLGSLSNLSYLVIESNNLEGDVYEYHFANLTKLRGIFASGNQLTLKVSSHWIPPFHLSTMDLKDWYLGPQFPRWLRSQKDIGQIGMSNTGISDVIPCWLWNFSSYNTVLIDLSENQIQGKIPDFPSHHNITNLNLNSNKLTGQLPRISVFDLDLSYNSLSGDISHFLCNPNDNLISSNAVKLSNNFLSGKIPDCWMYWPSLQIINLDNNNFSGEIPSSIGYLRQLGYLLLHNNSLIGEIPESIKNCSGLVGLDLGLNKLVGTIPRWLKHLPCLSVLILRSNNLQGIVPIELCALSELHVLDASNNNLSGIIPKCIKNLTAMTTKLHQTSSVLINLRTNYFERESTLRFRLIKSGVIAFLVIKGRENQYNRILGFLRSLDLSRNNISGELPKELTSLKALQSLNLSANCLSWSIPKMIGNLTDLESLDLSRNQLSGNIPPSMSSLTFLNFLNLSYNNLSGEIPTSTQLQSLNASSFIGNQLCGPPLLKTCREDHETTPTDATTEGGERQEEEYWFRLGIGMGFGVSFVGVIAPLLVCGFWRRAYFWFFQHYLWYKILDCFTKVKYMLQN